MWYVKLGMAALVAAFVANPALADSKKKRAKADDGVRVMSVTVDHNGTIFILSALAISKSGVDVCGAYFFEEGGSASSRVQAEQVLAKVYFTLDGRSLLVPARKFARYDNLAEARKTDKVGCVRTNRKPAAVKDPTSFAVKLAPGYIME